MPHVYATSLPTESLLHRQVGEHDFLDCYAVASKLPARQAAEVIIQFPGWVQFLLQIRRLLTAPFGLVNDAPPDTDVLGIFPVETETEQEVIAGFNDKHLDFRISVFAKEGKVFLATWVHTNNIGGKIYLKAIMPFHILIVRNALARVGKATYVKPAN